jgi:hypothetical protein
MVSKKGWRLLVTVRGRMTRQNVEVVDEFDYSEVTLENTGDLNR